MAATSHFTKPMTIIANKESTYGVSNDGGDTALEVLVDGEMSGTDENIEIETVSREYGLSDNISDSQAWEVTHSLKMAGSGTTAAPESSLYLQASANTEAGTIVLDVNDVSGDFVPGDVITNTTTPATVGIVAGVLDLVGKIDGTLTVNGAFTGVNTISVANSGPGFDGDTLNIGDSFVIGSDKYVLTAATTWTVTGNQDITFTPTLVTPLVGDEGVTLTGRRRLFITGLDTAPTVADALLGSISAKTAVTQAINNNSWVYRPVSTPADFSSLTIKQNQDDILKIANGVRGTGVLMFDLGDFAKFEFSFSGLFNVPTDDTISAGSVGCSDAKVVRNETVLFNGTDMRFHAVHGTQLDMAVEYTASKDVQREYTISEIIVTDAKPTGSITISKADMAQFDPYTLRLNGTKFPIQYHHNLSGAQYTRMSLIIPNAQLTSMPSDADNDGRQFYDIEFSVNKACEVALAKWYLFVY